MPAEVAWRLEFDVREGRLGRRRASVRSARVLERGLELQLDTGAAERVDRVILATGLADRRPGGPWIDAAVHDLGLPVAPCGSPLLDPELRWAPNLRAAGGLAELVVGPSARNLAGFGLAARRLSAA